MRTRNVLIAATLVSLAVGALVGASFAASGALNNEPPSFTVPVARMGDEADYVVWWNETQDAEGNPVNWIYPYALGIRVESVETAHDATFLDHETVKVAWTREQPPDWDCRSHGALLVDLVTRHMIRTDSETFCDFPGSPVSWNDHWYGPMVEEPYEYQTMRYTWPSTFLTSNLSYEVQGQSFTVGDDVTDQFLRGPFLENLVEGWDDAFYSNRVRPVDFAFESRVAGHGQIGKYEVFGLVRELTLDYVTIQEDAHMEYIAEDGYETGSERLWHEEQKTTYWLSPDIPWPVRIEREFVRHSDDPLVCDALGCFDDPIRNYTVVQDLVRYEPGDEPVDWRPWEPDHYREQDPAAFRSPEGTNHVIGGDGRLPYPYDEALGNVHADSSMTGFHDWLDAHPDAVLAGVWFKPRAPEDGSWRARNSGADYADHVVPEHQDVVTWSFVYAAPGPVGAPDQAYGVTSSYNVETDRVANGDWGADGLDEHLAFTVDDLPERPVTIEYLDRVWQELTPPEVSDPFPTAIGWGLRLRVNTPDCGVAVDGQTLVNTTVDCGGAGYAERRASESNAMIAGPDDPWSDLLVNNMIETVAVDGMPPEPVPTERFESILMDAETGRIHYTVYDFQREYTLGMPVADLLASEPQEASVATAGSDSIDPFVATAVAAASLLSVLLFAYFLPLIRHGAAWLIGIVPGYAKLKKSELLDNEYRERIVELVKREPGISPSQLHRRMGGGWSTIVYHLRVLEKNDILTSVIDGRHKRVFPAGEIDRRDLDALTVLRNDRTREFLDLVEDEPGAHQSALARRIGISQVAARWHLKRLKGVGLVGADRIGRKVCYYPLKPAPDWDASPEVA